MIKYKDSKVLNYSTVQLFDLVSDIEAYPEFIPWVSKVKILRKNGNIVEAELFIKYKKLNSHFSSKVVMNQPESKSDDASVKVFLIEGPFKHLMNEWIFVPTPEGTELTFLIEFSFKSRILQKTIEPIFNKAADKITKIFEKRAKDVYKR